MEDPMYENVFELQRKSEKSNRTGNTHRNIDCYDSDDDSGTGSYARGKDYFSI
jgi:hypothetical protein